ncbi:hypothetical protein QWZ13_03400 [Reinekea marina]|uniref:hypothetical protein n=1 Tax=Reinekea marina TaxID=1310421 RepID=UPI0025B3E746|nr:hypothetical protein [Reinekea marina]MDN3647958.1 hypothetical protein [Reinekea marina]
MDHRMYSFRRLTVIELGNLKPLGPVTLNSRGAIYTRTRHQPQAKLPFFCSNTIRDLIKKTAIHKIPRSAKLTTTPCPTTM